MLLIVFNKANAQQLLSKDSCCSTNCLNLLFAEFNGLINSSKFSSIAGKANGTDSSLILSDSIITEKIKELKRITALPVQGMNGVKKTMTENIEQEMRTINKLNQRNDRFNSKPVLSLDAMEINYTFSATNRDDSAFIDNNVAQHFTYAKADITVMNFMPLTVTYMMRNSNSQFYNNYNDFQLTYNSTAATNRYKKIAAEQKRQLNSLFSKQKLFNILNSKYKLADTIEKKLQSPLVQEYLQKIRSGIAGFNKGYSVDPKQERELFYKKADSLLKNNNDSSCIEEREQLLGYINKLKEFEMLFDSCEAKLRVLKEHIDSVKRIYRKYEVMYDNVKDGNYGDILKRSGLVDTTTKTTTTAVEDKVPKGFGFLSGLKQLSVGRSVGNASPLSFSGYSIKGLIVEYNKNNFYGYAAAGTIDNSLRINKKFFRDLDQKKIVLGRIGYGSLDKNIIIFSVWNGYTGKSNSPSVSNKTSGSSVQVKYTLTQRLYFVGEFARSFNTGTNKNPLTGNTAYSLQFNGRYYKRGLFFSGLYRHFGDAYTSYSTERINNLKESWRFQADKKFFRNAVAVKLGVKKNFFEAAPLPGQFTLSSDNILKTASVSIRFKKLPQIMVAYQPLTQIVSVDNAINILTVQTYTASLTHQFKTGIAMNNTSIVYNKVASAYRDSNFLLQSASMFSMQHQVQFRKFSSLLNIDVIKNREVVLTTMQGGHAFNPVANLTIGMGYKIYAYNNSLVSDNKVGFYNNLRYSFKNKYSLNLNMERSFITTNQLKLVKYENYFLTLNLKLK